MMSRNHFILVAGDIDNFRKSKPSALQVIAFCVAQSVWPLGGQARYLSVFAKGDRVLFYAGGMREHRCSIVGCGTIAEEVRSAPVELDDKTWPNRLTLKGARLFRNPVEVKPLVEKLGFVKNKKNWGASFRGGIVRLSEEEYNLLVGLGSARRSAG